MKKDLAYYRGLPYRMELGRFEEEEDGQRYYCASYIHLPQVKGVHQDRLMAIKLARNSFDSFVEARLQWGEKIEEPETPRYREPGGFSKIWPARGVSHSAAKATPESLPSLGVGTRSKSELVALS